MNSAAWAGVAAEEAGGDAVHSAMRLDQKAKSIVYGPSY